VPELMPASFSAFFANVELGVGWENVVGNRLEGGRQLCVCIAEEDLVLGYWLICSGGYFSLYVFGCREAILRKLEIVSMYLGTLVCDGNGLSGHVAECRRQYICSDAFSKVVFCRRVHV
jgi:hypothetical protein